MTKLIAIHEIVRNGANGKLETIRPGKSFDASEAEVKFFLSRQAARKPNEGETGVVDQAPEVGQQLVESTVGTLAGVQNEDGSTTALEDMKVDELREIAKEMEIEGFATLRKAELIDAIKAEQVEAGDEII